HGSDRQPSMQNLMDVTETTETTRTAAAMEHHLLDKITATRTEFAINIATTERLEAQHRITTRDLGATFITPTDMTFRNAEWYSNVYIQGAINPLTITTTTTTTTTEAATITDKSGFRIRQAELHNQQTYVHQRHVPHDHSVHIRITKILKLWTTAANQQKNHIQSAEVSHLNHLR
ncbi:MAG: hypothetical protein ACREOZ_02020, partial [Gloeomargaritales cyanobacterium]